PVRNGRTEEALAGTALVGAATEPSAPGRPGVAAAIRATPVRPGRIGAALAGTALVGAATEPSAPGRPAGAGWRLPSGPGQGWTGRAQSSPGAGSAPSGRTPGQAPGEAAREAPREPGTRV